MGRASLYRGRGPTEGDIAKTVGPYEKRFCNALREWVDKNLTHGEATEYARHFGVSRQQWSNILAGRRGMTESWRRRVARELGLDYEDMVAGDDEQSPVEIEAGLIKSLLFLKKEDIDAYNEVFERIVGKATILKSKLASTDRASDRKTPAPRRSTPTDDQEAAAW
ncbi:hypothetical protein TRIP_B350389 [uncultured Desulfatiglans sp.]|nr:hypothetical protein TRIP_B350389 [uncultured Desulfatiglans sp.]